MTATRLSWPEIAATSGAVTSCAASAMPTASASGLGHRRDHDQCRCRRHRQRETDIHGQLWGENHQRDDRGRQHRDTLAPPGRHHREQCDRTHHCGAQDTRGGLNHDDEYHQGRRGQCGRRPGSDQAGRQQYRTADDRDIGT